MFQGKVWVEIDDWDNSHNRSRANLKRLYMRQHEFLPAKRKSHGVVVIRNFLSDGEIAAVHEIARPVIRRKPWALELGRDKSTGYAQYVHRLEQELHDQREDLFNRIIGTAWVLDSKYWRKFPFKQKISRPQIEYIDYDVDRMGKTGSFDAHVDNYAAVTSIILLTRPKIDFKGGVNYFRVNGTHNWCEGEYLDPTAKKMKVPLQSGDAIFFRGEALVHGIGAVTRGRRVVLQTEMSVNRWSNDDGEIPGKDCIPQVN